LTVCVPAALALAEEAARSDKPFIFSLSAPFIPQVFKEALDQVSPFWDYVVGNETEAAAYADSHDLGTQDIPTIAVALANLPKKNERRKRMAIITQGAGPTVAAVQGQSVEDVKMFPVRSIRKEEIVDTTGAGDAFLGGFIAGVVQGAGLERCVDMGQWLASLSIRELGPS
jgi:adenosine kinase